MAGYNVKMAPKGAYGTKSDPNKWTGGIYINVSIPEEINVGFKKYTHMADFSKTC